MPYLNEKQRSSSPVVLVQVYIWHVDGEEPIAVVSGHTRCVNAVAWNPRHHDVLVSASDDYSLRLWGPRAHTQ